MYWKNHAERSRVQEGAFQVVGFSFFFLIYFYPNVSDLSGTDLYDGDMYILMGYSQGSKSVQMSTASCQTTEQLPCQPCLRWTESGGLSCILQTSAVPMKVGASLGRVENLNNRGREVRN